MKDTFAVPVFLACLVGAIIAGWAIIGLFAWAIWAVTT